MKTEIRGFILLGVISPRISKSITSLSGLEASWYLFKFLLIMAHSDVLLRHIPMFVYFSVTGFFFFRGWDFFFRWRFVDLIQPTGFSPTGSTRM